MTSTTYSNYVPLDVERKEIRLLTIEPQGPNQPPTFRLVTVSLLDDPAFIALSYVWGDPTPIIPVTIDDGVVHVAANLAEALQDAWRVWVKDERGVRGSLSSDVCSLALWVDALCINQADFVEKSFQVRLMRLIYPQAVEVFSWIGDREDNSVSLALRAFAEIYDNVKPSAESPPDASSLSLDWLEHHPALNRVDEEIEGRKHGESWLRNAWWYAVWRFFQHDYWRRVWVVQELVLANSTLVFSRSRSIEFDALQHAVNWAVSIYDNAYLHNLQRPLGVSSVAWQALTDSWIGWERILRIARVRDWSTLATPGRSWSILTEFPDLCTTNPRDHVYGLIGVVELNAEPTIIPDYTKSMTEVFLDAVTRWVEEEQYLGFLNMAGVAKMGSEPGMPSWLPRFDISPSSAHLIPAQSIADRAVFDDLEERLHVSGSILRTYGIPVASLDMIHACPKLETWLDGQMLRFCTNRTMKNNFYDPIPPLEAIFRVLLKEQQPADSVERQAFMALAFLKCLFFGFGNFNPRNLRFFEAAGLKTGNGFVSSFIEMFFPSFEDELRNRIPNITTEAGIMDVRVQEAAGKFLVLIVQQLGDNVHFVEFDPGLLGLTWGLPALGDEVFVLKGCSFPVLLRRGEAGRFVLVGECFVLGLMDEAVQLEGLENATILELEIQ